MMGEKKEMTWYQQEYEEILKERKKQPDYQPARVVDLDAPRPKLSDILECARLAKQQPEIWELAKEEALIPPEEWSDDRNHLMPAFTGPLYRWYMSKNGLQDYLPYAFMSIGAIVREWTRPDFTGDDLAVVREQLRSADYIDDLSEKKGVGQ